VSARDHKRRVSLQRLAWAHHLPTHHAISSNS
jgi:hypothetical protein